MSVRKRDTSPDLTLPLDGSLVTRFWRKVTKSDGCWEWTDYTRSGYGSLSFKDRERRTHRLSWLLHFGAIRDGLFVLHSCDNRRCVRPDHLFLGAQLNNVRDMWKKGRASEPPKHAGIQHPMATKSDDIVARARELRAIGIKQRDVARQLGVSQATVWRWAHGKTRAG
jgi:hypothetical protein